jgi:hypothetical protein
MTDITNKVGFLRRSRLCKPLSCAFGQLWVAPSSFFGLDIAYNDNILITARSPRTHESRFTFTMLCITLRSIGIVLKPVFRLAVLVAPLFLIPFDIVRPVTITVEDMLTP